MLSRDRVSASSDKFNEDTYCSSKNCYMSLFAGLEPDWGLGFTIWSSYWWNIFSSSFEVKLIFRYFVVPCSIFPFESAVPPCDLPCIPLPFFFCCPLIATTPSWLCLEPYFCFPFIKGVLLLFLTDTTSNNGLLTTCINPTFPISSNFLMHNSGCITYRKCKSSSFRFLRPTSNSVSISKYEATPWTSKNDLARA